MPQGCLLYCITDRSALAGDERTRRRRVLEKVSEAAACGVDYIQLREKDLPVRELESLTSEAMAIIRQMKVERRDCKTALLINSRADVALASGADGVHLRSEDVSPEDVRIAWKSATGGLAAGATFDEPRAGCAREVMREPLIGVSCHSPEDVGRAAANRATFAVFGPVFEKKDATPAGLEKLREACHANIPVLALGGTSLQNAELCLQAGAAGIAGIRLFQENDIAGIVQAIGRLRQASTHE